MHGSEYLPLFLAECREELHELNLAVIRLADRPEDRETIDAIFRVAHSLKGNAATRAHARISERFMVFYLRLRREQSGGEGEILISDRSFAGIRFCLRKLHSPVH